MDILRSALQLAYVKGNVEEAIRLAENLSSEKEKATAVLYKVAEDKNVTANELRGMHFPKDVVDATELLLADEEGFDNYIERISFNALASAVKYAEIELQIGNEKGLRFERLSEALRILR